MSIELFNYHLPEDRIAQQSVEPRDHSKLMIMHRSDRSIDHRSFFEIGEYLREGDVLVMNQSKVFRARLHGKKVYGTIDIEVTLLRPDGEIWQAMVYPGRRLKIDDVVMLGPRRARVVQKTDEGVTCLQFDCSDTEVFALCDEIGEIPIPPYVDQLPQSLDEYQTIYAQETGSVAAPTAGFHFTDQLMRQLKRKGVQFEFVTLHVGLGTFQPFKGETLEDHKMHSEFVQIDTGTAKRIRVAKEEGRRIIAVGTTTTRALEGSGIPEGGFSGEVNLFMKPGFDFKIIDGLMTNFHLPKTTLLVLVRAFAGREFVSEAYDKAIMHDYRFFSFGDAMLIL